jgi:hypothetical protein
MIVFTVDVILLLVTHVKNLVLADMLDKNATEEEPIDIVSLYMKLDKLPMSQKKTQMLNTAAVTARRSGAHWARAVFWCIHQHLILANLHESEKLELGRLLRVRVEDEERLFKAEEDPKVGELRRYRATTEIVGCMEAILQRLRGRFTLDFFELVRVAYALKRVCIIPEVKTGGAQLEEKIPSHVDEANLDQSLLPMKDLYVLKLHMVYFRIVHTWDDGDAQPNDKLTSSSILPLAELRRIAKVEELAKSKATTAAPLSSKKQKLSFSSPKATSSNQTTPPTTSESTSGAPGTDPLLTHSSQDDGGGAGETVIKLFSTTEATPSMTKTDWTNLKTFLRDDLFTIHRANRDSDGVLHAISVVKKSLPFECLEWFWNIVFSTSRKCNNSPSNIQQQDLYEECRTKLLLPHLMFEYAHELQQENKRNVIPGNGYCLYSTVYYLMCLAEGKQFRECDFKDNNILDFKVYMEDLLQEFELDIVFWQDKINELPEDSINDHLPVDLTTTIDPKSPRWIGLYRNDLSNWLTIMIKARDQLKASVSKVKINPHKDLEAENLPQALWGGSELSILFLSERKGQPILSFNKTIGDAHYYKALDAALGWDVPGCKLNPEEKKRMLYDKMISLCSCNSKQLVSKVEETSAYTYYGTSAIRDSLRFSYRALLEILNQKIPSFVCKASHNFPINFNHQNAVNFVTEEVEQVCKYIFTHVLELFLDAIREGATNFMSKGEYISWIRKGWEKVEQNSSIHVDLSSDDPNPEEKLHDTPIAANEKKDELQFIVNNKNWYRKDLLDQIYEDAVKQMLSNKEKVSSYKDLTELLQDFAFNITNLSLQLKKEG